MVKGCQKRMIFIKNTGCDLFDEAYFVLKNDVDTAGDTEHDIIRAATAIINEQQFPHKRKKRAKNRSKKWLLFFLGMAIGAIICALAFIIF